MVRCQTEQRGEPQGRDDRDTVPQPAEAAILARPLLVVGLSAPHPPERSHGG